MGREPGGGGRGAAAGEPRGVQTSQEGSQVTGACISAGAAAGEWKGGVSRQSPRAWRLSRCEGGRAVVTEASVNIVACLSGSALRTSLSRSPLVPLGFLPLSFSLCPSFSGALSSSCRLSASLMVGLMDRDRRSRKV